jgi:copper homeostasis protein
MAILEVIAFTHASCLKIRNAGAQRIELCSGPGEGGTTPSHGLIKAARISVSIDLFPIIRPRGGDFLYTNEEFDIMKNDILFCRSEGCNGVVIGMLNADGTIDRSRCETLVRLAYPMSVTFHRAFDRTSDPFKAVEDIIEIGCERILTSGLRPTAHEGLQALSSLIEQSGNRIIIMPGSGIRSDNILQIAAQTGATEFHSSARKSSASKMEFINSEMKEELNMVEVDEEEVRRMVALLADRP